MDELLNKIRELQDLYDDPNIITTADQINRPEPKQEVKDIEAINEFMKRNPRADGGRIGLSKAGVVRKGRVGGEYEGLFGVRAKNRSAADNIPGATKFGQETVYFKTEKDAKNFLKNFDKYKKIAIRGGTTRSDDPNRLKKIDDYVKKYEKDFGRKPSARNIRDNLNEQRRVVKAYEKEYGKLDKIKATDRITNVQRDIVKILKDPKIVKKLNADKFPTITDISRITKLDPTLSETRLVDLAEKLRENPKYKKLADDYLAQPGTPGDFGGRKTKRSRTILENRFQKLMQLDQKLPSLRTNILKKIQKLIPELKGVLAVDEIAGITTSMRRGSGPYAIFGQVLGGDFNTQVKGSGVDKIKGQIEKQLIKLPKGSPERIEVQKKYNAAVTEFENKANIDNPAKKVKGLKVSFKPPSETIKNKKIYNQYKNLFDTHYKTYGYSFEVPADRDSLVDISKKLDNKSFQGIIKNRFKNLINKGGKIGAGVGLATLAGTGFALADDTLAADSKSLLPEAAAGTAAAGTAFKYRKPITKVAKKVIPKILAPLGIGLEGYFAKQGYDQGKTIPEIAAAPFMLEGLVSDAQERLRMSPAERQALNRQQIAQDFSVMDSDFATPYIKGSNEVDVDAARLRAQREETLARARRAQQRQGVMTQGLSSGGVASGPPPESGPTPHGLPSLMKRGMKI
jgi:hypothetical protein